MQKAVLCVIQGTHSEIPIQAAQFSYMRSRQPDEGQVIHLDRDSQFNCLRELAPLSRIGVGAALTAVFP